MLKIKRFNIRVYGILFNKKKQVLVEDALIRGQKYTKFPGGGLEFGESTIDCLKREFMEETGALITIKKHFYTSDIFQPSAFDDDSQVISIYYKVGTQELDIIKTSKKKFNIKPLKSINESFRWAELPKLLKEKYFSLPLDRIVVSMLTR